MLLRIWWAEVVLRALQEKFAQAWRYATFLAQRLNRERTVRRLTIELPIAAPAA